MAKRRYRRRARRLRRFRRSRRSSFRRRYTRSRRSFRRWRRRGGWFYRRKGFYQRRGYKLAVTRFRASGIFTRTYKFYCNPYLIQNDNGQVVEYGWEDGAPPGWSGTYLPVSYSFITWSKLRALSNRSENVQSKQFTGPCNMYGVTELPLDAARVLGYREYTVINLSQLGLFWLFWNNDFINQRQLLVEDLKKYSYYRALSVTIKFAPRYSSIPGKVSSIVPTTINLPSYSIGAEQFNITPDRYPAGTWTGGSTVAAGGAWAQTNVPQFTNDSAITADASSPAAFGPYIPISAWDRDAYTLIGYLIPGTPSETSGTVQANFPGWSDTTFGRIVDMPTLQWFSSFRKAGYPRSYISRNKPTSFKFLLPQGATTAQVNTPISVDNPQQLYGYYSTTGDNMYTPFTGHKECVKPGLMPAEMISLNPRVSSATASAKRDMQYPKYWNTANCNLFIPGATPTQLLDRYKISFSYKFQYYSRVYDDN